jgi:hypothetical protein
VQNSRAKLDGYSKTGLRATNNRLIRIKARLSLFYMIIILTTCDFPALEKEKKIQLYTLMHLLLLKIHNKF